MAEVLGQSEKSINTRHSPGKSIEKYAVQIHIHWLELTAESDIPLTVTWKKRSATETAKLSTKQAIYTEQGRREIDEELHDVTKLHRKSNGTYGKKNIELKITALHHKKQRLGQVRVPIKDPSEFPISSEVFPVKAHNGKSAQICLSIALRPFTGHETADIPEDSPDSSESIREQIAKLNQEVCNVQSQVIQAKLYAKRTQEKQHLETENARLRELLRSKEDELANLHSEDLDELKQEKRRLKRRIHELETQREEPQESVETAEGASSCLDSQLERLSSQIDVLLNKKASSS